MQANALARGEGSWFYAHQYLPFKRAIPISCMFDPMADLSRGTSGDMFGMNGGPAPVSSGSQRPPSRFADDIHSVTIHARQRTFYIDLKQSGNGKFFKVSEKSRGGQKSTIMFDVEDLDKFIAAFTEMKTKLV